MNKQFESGGIKRVRTEERRGKNDSIRSRLTPKNQLKEGGLLKSFKVGHLKNTFPMKRTGHLEHETCKTYLSGPMSRLDKLSQKLTEPNLLSKISSREEVSARVL